MKTTRNDIIRMAREAKADYDDGVWLLMPDELERFAALVAAAEREAMAEVNLEFKTLTDEYLEKLAETHHTNCYFDTLTYARAIIAKLNKIND